MRELKNKVMEYKERLKLEEQKNAQSNDFAFDDDELARINVENDMLNKKVRAIEEDMKDMEKDRKDAVHEANRMKRSMESINGQLEEAKHQVNELKGLCNRLELANESLKQNGAGPGGERVAASTLKQFSELEKKYIQTKK